MTADLDLTPPKPLSGRDAYRAELTKLAIEDERILCLEADLGGKGHAFAAQHPDRFVNVGIAEGTMIDMAAGLASAGYRPFISTFATFAAMRAAESIKLSLGYMQAPITIVAPYAGVSGGWFGTTHHCLEDLAVVGAFPGVVIAAPYGEEETRAVIRAAAAGDSPTYVRVGRNAAYRSLIPYSGAEIPAVVWQDSGAAVKSRRAPVLVSVGEFGTELCLEAVAARPELRLRHAHLVYADEQHLAASAAELRAEHDDFVVVEEHRGWGGAASALARLLPDCSVRSVAADGGWPAHGGSQHDVAAELGLDLNAVLAAVSAR